MPETAQIGILKAPVDANPAPKVRYREFKDNISRHRAMLESHEFQRAIDFSLLQYQRELAAACGGPQDTGFVGAKMTGAQEFVKILMTLAEASPIIRNVVTDNLDHRV